MQPFGMYVHLRKEIFKLTVVEVNCNHNINANYNLLKEFNYETFVHMIRSTTTLF